MTINLDAIHFCSQITSSIKYSPFLVKFKEDQGCIQVTYQGILGFYICNFKTDKAFVIISCSYDVETIHSSNVEEVENYLSRKI